MRVLLIKTSSMGDLIHTLPALTDAITHYPQLKFDWLVEKSFAEIPSWHPAVDQVIAINFRTWRKNLLAKQTHHEWREARLALAKNRYDYILDAQGLLKSAFYGFFAKGERVGLDWASAREPWASLMYQRKCRVNSTQHAVIRMRELFSKALRYDLPNTLPNFKIHMKNQTSNNEPYVVFLHGTTWETKLWPEQYWISLAKIANDHGYGVKISGGNDKEVLRAYRIAQKSQNVEVLPRLKIIEMAQLISGAAGAVAVDTGFGHLAAALAKPTVSLYGPTNPALTGAVGEYSHHINATFSCAPCLKRTCQYVGPKVVTPACFASLPPISVWQALAVAISETRT